MADSFMARSLQHLNDARPLMPMYIHIILSALFPIYTGAHASLSRPASAAKPSKDKTRSNADDEDEEEAVQKMDGLSPQDALILPLVAAIVLGALYWLIKKYGAELINLILGWYFAAVGLFSLAKLLHDGMSLAVSFVFPKWFWDQRQIWRIHDSDRTVKMESKSPRLERKSPLPGLTGRISLPHSLTDRLWSTRATVKQKYTITGHIATLVEFRANITSVTVLATLLGASLIAYANLVDCPWWLTNIQGFAVCYSALQFLSPTTFATGSLILSGLFFYDIWAVFFTPLMVTVAKNLDQPIKLVFPRPEEPGEEGRPPAKGYSMLGLGDIVLPGIMIGLALRYDLHMHYVRKQEAVTKSVSKDERAEAASVTKAEYVQVTGRWGDSFWTWGAPESAKPSQLRSAVFSKPYFTASLVGYVLGMVVTLAVITVFDHAQPALLYLVPAVLLSLWGTGLARGELKQMWDFSEGVMAEAEEDPEGAKKTTDDDKPVEQSDGGFFARPFMMIWQELFGSVRGNITVKETDTKTEALSGNANTELLSENPDINTTESEEKDEDLLVSFSIRRVANKSSVEQTPTSPKQTASAAAAGGDTTSVS